MTQPQEISIDQYDYPLPEERIARHPLPERDRCRLLAYNAADATTQHVVFTDLTRLLEPGSMMVFNNTRVINARLRFRKPSGAAIEIFCLEPLVPADYQQSFACDGTKGCAWTCLVGNSKRWKEGDVELNLTRPDGTPFRLSATRLSSPDHTGACGIQFHWDATEMTWADVISAAGEIPIPPYLNRATEATDLTDYQTVYSKFNGSVAAPTAGLHFTPALLEAIDRRGVERREVTLHVGAGTFRPVKADTIGGHDMHAEFITVPLTLIRDLADALRHGRTITAVGTTSVRTLESLYHIGCMMSQGTWEGELPQWYPYGTDHPGLAAADALDILARHLDDAGEDRLDAYTRIIIAPGYQYRLVGAMVTNFHQPQSTLLLLVSAFIGPAWRQVYQDALDNDYRFLSYGDGCYFYKR